MNDSGRRTAARACLLVASAADQPEAESREQIPMSRLLEAAQRGEYMPAKAGEAALPAAYDDSDPFLAHGMGGGSGNHIIGKILKVPAGQNGEYSFKGAGDADDTVLPRGSEVLVAIDKLVLRWTRWENNKVADQIAGYLADGFKPPRRETLGHLDEDEWEKDDAGRPRDPWKLENLVPMKEQKSGELLTAFVNGKGSADDAVRHLVLSYGRTDRTKYPVVRLGRDSFVSKRNGHRSWFPTLPLTGLWLPKAEFGRLETGDPVVKVDRAPHRGYANHRDYQAPPDWGQDGDPGPELSDYR